MLSAVMVPLDGTVLAEEAVPFALAVARRTGAEIHPVLVHLTDHFQDLGLQVSMGEPAGDGELMVREEAYLESLAERITAGEVRVHDPVVLRGEVTDALTTHVHAHGIDGVVMSTHGRGSVERFLMPSVAEGLLHRLTVPMLLHRFDPDAPMSDRLRAALPFRTVLVALDGSADAEVALDRALEVVEPDGRVVLFRVADPPPMLSSVYLPHAAVIQREEEERRRQEALSYLDRSLERVAGGTLDVETGMVVDRHPAEAILALASEEGCDLIALGSHGHGALRQALFGSVTHAVLQKSGAPVLVARRED